MTGGARIASALSFPRRLLALLDRLATEMAYLAGLVLLLVSLYITADVIGRKFTGVSSGVTDEFGGYALAVGGLWALAFALTTGAHVRIDVLLPHFSRRLQACLNYLALALMAGFAAVVAWYSWKLALESLSIDARAMSFVRTPLFVPQGAMALGFTLLMLHAFVILLVGLAESVRDGTLAPVPVLRVEGLTEGL